MTVTQNCTCGCTSADGAHLERVRYFPRQLITPDVLTQEQEYFRARLRRHNRLLHGWGIVCGAEVVQSESKSSEVTIKSGFVLGPYGDEILIDDDLTVDVCKESPDGNALPCGNAADPWCGEVRVTRPTGQPLYLAVKYADCPTRPVRAYPSGCGCGCEEGDCQYSRIRDSFVVKVLTELPDSYANAPAPPDASALPSPCGKNGPGRPCPPCPSDPWVILATLTLSDECTVSTVNAYAHRRYALSFADYFVICKKPTITADEPGTVGHVAHVPHIPNVNV